VRFKGGNVRRWNRRQIILVWSNEGNFLSTETKSSLVLMKTALEPGPESQRTAQAQRFVPHCCRLAVLT